MAESIQTEDLLAKLESQQTNKLQKLIALERLSESCENGFNTADLELMVKKVSLIKGASLAVQLLDCCLPAGDVSPATIDRAVFVMANPHTQLTLKRALLGWLLAGVQRFLPEAARRHLHTHYGPIFGQVERLQLVNLACTLLYLITEHSDVQRHRVEVLLSQREALADSGPRWALIRKYRQLRPDLVQRPAGADPAPRWERPRAQLAANLQRWAQRRGAAGGTAAAGDAGGDLWDMVGKISRRESALPVLPESVPTPSVGPDPWQGCWELSSLGSLREVAAEGALGFRAANNLTALALTARGRTALLISDRRQLDAAKINQDLLISLRQMLVHDARHYRAQHWRQLIRQLSTCHLAGIPLSAGRYLLRALLEGAKADTTALWLPALDLLPFYGWRPQHVIQAALLRPLETLLERADRHARLRVVTVLTEWVVRLARVDLKLVERRQFPYDTYTCRDEIGSSSDPAVDVARVTTDVAELCKRLSTSGPRRERANLLRATVHFYTEVTPALLEAGVPYVPAMGRDLVYQVLLGSDPLAVSKLLLMFSRYREQSSQLASMQADPALSRVRVKLSIATVARLQALTSLIEDMLRLVFGVRKGAGGQFRGHSAEGRAALTALMKDAELELDNHTALVSYQQLAETRPEYQEGESNQALLLTLVSADGLVGFTAFREACTASSRRRH